MLFPFQQDAVDKFAAMSQNMRSVLICDDMGLGKTVQAIALDTLYRGDKLPTEVRRKDFKPKTLVVAPLSVLSSWADHFAEWQPDLRVYVINPKRRDDFRINLEFNRYDVYIVHWDVLRLMPELQDRLWLHVIGDEIHRIGARDTQVTQSFKKIRTVFKTGLSGTPAQTRPQDLWSILNWLYPKRFTSYWRFFNTHVKHVYHTVGFCQAQDCMKQHKRAFREITGVGEVEALQAEMSPYYIRRLKSEVLKDLPDKYYTPMTVELGEKQRRAYNQMRDDMLAWIGQHEDEPLAAPVAVAKLVRLQQLSAAYAEVRTVYRNGEAMSVVRLTDPSAKLDAVMQLVQDNPTEPFVVFSISKQVVYLLKERLVRAGLSHGLLTGDTPSADRGRLVRAFQAGDCQVFAGTISAGGVGLTLTAASKVVFIDRAWSPAVNAQAEDRLHRIGQENAVQVIDIIGKDTVDLGKLQHLEVSWSWLKALLGDKDEVNGPASTLRIRSAVERLKQG